MDDIILSVAPSVPWKGEEKNPRFAPEKIIEEAVHCTEEGASIIHLHPGESRDMSPRKMGGLEETFRGIYDRTDLIIEAGTNRAPGLAPEERILPATLEGTVFSSLSMGSFNGREGVYTQTTEQILLYLDRMEQYGVKPTLEIYDTGHLAFARYLIDEGHLIPPFNFTFKFNIPWGMVFSRELLSYLVSQLPQESNWGALFAGARDFTSYLSAAELGADFLRVGFEHSPLLGGPEVFTNAQLVRLLRQQLEERGRKAMSPHDTIRKMLLSC
ncbi:MAG: 3-keto-5-aminohexanoate cleavage protein [Spirochaetales bacterium]|nr:3-keto-5-aminohexanoate cleavage protein [Spirochaetales bacterium]